MKLKKLGSTGTLVSELCLGTMTFGWTTPEDESRVILDQFLSNGGNFIDTADVYSQGNSERIIGKWLSRQDRESVVIATKSRFRTGDHANSVGLSRKHLMHSVKESMSRLGTDYIDLFQLHAWDPLTPIEETLSTLNSLVENGSIRYIGMSNFRAWQFEKALQICRARGWHEPVSIQPQYSILVRSTEYEILPMATSERIAVLPWSPLAGGILSGKYREGISKAPKGTRAGDSRNAAMYLRYDNDRTARVLKTLSEISQETGKTMTQIALNWLLRNPAVTSPIIGTRNSAQLAENLGSTGWCLDANQCRAIEEASFMEVTYPYDPFSEEQQNRERELA